MLNISPLFIPIFAIAFGIGGWVITTWIRAKHGYPLTDDNGRTVHRENPEAGRQIALLSRGNEKLSGQVARLEERIAVLERIVTDPGHATARAIDELR